MTAALPLAEQDYPLLNLFWTLLIAFCWALWLFLVIRILIDVFRSRDLGGWAKAGWTVLIIVVPLIGMLAYLIARGKGMADRDAALGLTPEQPSSGANGATSQTSVAEEVNKLAALRDKGLLTDQEFAAQKAKVLA
jgi:phospholipase D-like protein/putative oligomerization/nucleic acid binding protein